MLKGRGSENFLQFVTEEGWNLSKVTCTCVMDNLWFQTITITQIHYINVQQMLVVTLILSILVLPGCPRLHDYMYVSGGPGDQKGWTSLVWSNAYFSITYPIQMQSLSYCWRTYCHGRGIFPVWSSPDLSRTQDPCEHCRHSLSPTQRLQSVRIIPTSSIIYSAGALVLIDVRIFRCSQTLMQMEYVSVASGVDTLSKVKE